MGLLLNIDTAVEKATISIAKDGIILQEAVNNDQKEHGTFLQPAIQLIAKNAGICLQELDAVAVIAGPGSYTGLRVAMATAKGLCYALDKPLIAIGTLDLMAYQAIKQFAEGEANTPFLYCPMIDARRMEVFTAVYDKFFAPVLQPCAIIIEENSFANQLLKNKVCFFGNGSPKWQKIVVHENALFFEPKNNALYMSELSHGKYLNNEFADMAYAEPMYLKEFYNNPT
ncbi:MAG: tRNA (adenosine(37)-N6)-threonylcarbamoyltransferase complex dimerization subunit type 1 TsaB [Ferruginibacter sp.]